MKNLTELLGKPVLSLYESKIQGIVKDVLFDKDFKKLKYLILFDDNELEEEKIIKVCDIYTDGKNAIMIKNAGCIFDKSIIIDEKQNPINNDCYNISGEYQGKVIDVLLDEKYYIDQIVLNNTNKVMCQNIITSGEDVVFVQDDEKIVKLCWFKPKGIKNNTENNNIKVEILRPQVSSKLNEEENEIINLIDDENDSNEMIKDENENIIINEDEKQEIPDIKIEPIKPKKKTILTTLNLPLTKATKDNFLIGRKVTQNIYSQNHELVIRKNTRITEKTIITAKTYSVIKELSVFSE